jgi:NACHT domain
MHGRIVVDGRDQGGGCALTPEIVVTAAHVVRAAGPDSRVTFATAGREAIAVESIDRDIELDLAALRLTEPVVPSYVSDAAMHDRWEVSVPARGRDAFLTGTVDVALRDFENDKGHNQQVVQLRVDQELKQFAGYSGSGVRLPAADGAVAGVLTEQQLERTRSGPDGARPEAANVLFAVPVAVALNRFGLTSAAALRPSLPGDTEVQNFMSGVLGSAGQPVPFGGRATELHGLDQWVADPSAAPRMLVVAPAGSGKSTLLAHWLHDRPAPLAPDGQRPAVVFVPLNGRFETAQRDTFYRIMTARIARAYRENAALAGRGWDDLLEEQSRLLRRPPPDGSLLIVIDGLDEALGWSPGPNWCRRCWRRAYVWWRPPG